MTEQTYKVMMACGHSANATTTDENGNTIPCCVICATSVASRTIAEAPSLEGRFAKCAYKSPGRYGRADDPAHTTGVPSSLSLAFFEYQGPGSSRALTMCKCGYYITAHTDAGEYLGKHLKNADGTPNERAITHPFDPVGPYEFDVFYCGCFGWD